MNEQNYFPVVKASWKNEAELNIIQCPHCKQLLLSGDYIVNGIIFFEGQNVDSISRCRRCNGKFKLQAKELSYKE
jgi:hypothetical protein